MNSNHIKRKIISNHRYLEANIEDIIKTGIDIIIKSKMNKAPLFDKKEITCIIEGLFLRGCSYWEKFLADELIYLIALNKNNLLNTLEISENINVDIKLIKALINFDSYRDLHNIEKSRHLFKTYIVEENNIFSNLGKEQINKIDTVYAIRNYLAHQSDFAKKKLVKEYKDVYEYPYFIEPGVFLTKNKGKYFDNLLHNFCLSSVTMKKYLK